MSCKLPLCHAWKYVPICIHASIHIWTYICPCFIFTLHYIYIAKTVIQYSRSLILGICFRIHACVLRCASIYDSILTTVDYFQIKLEGEKWKSMCVFYCIFVPF